MCDPITLAAIGLTAAGVGAKAYAQHQVDEARAGAMEIERIRQRQYDAESSALSKASQQNYDDFGGQEQQVSNELADYFTEASNTAPTPAMLPATNSQATNIAVQDATAVAKEDARKQSLALADLRSFGDLFGSIGLQNARNASQIGTLAGFSAGSANVLPMELEAANGAGQFWNTVGDIASAAGSVASGAALGGGTLFGLGAPAATGVTAAAAPMATTAATKAAVNPLSYALF